MGAPTEFHPKAWKRRDRPKAGARSERRSGATRFLDLIKQEMPFVFPPLAILAIKSLLLEIASSHGITIAKFAFRKMIRQMKDKMEKAFNHELVQKSYAEHVKEHRVEVHRRKQEALRRLKQEMIEDIKRAHLKELDRKLRKKTFAQLKEERDGVAENE